MNKINYWAVIAAAVAAFLMSSLYYSPLLLGDIWRAVDPAAVVNASAAKAAAEFLRTLIITLVIARILTLLGGHGWRSGFRLALLLWFAFSAMMWTGAVMWENTPWQLAAIHSGDWLVKTALIALIVGVWHDKKLRRMTHGSRVSVREA